ncbi:MAG: DUF401 family protein [Ignisphaera sp.]
MELLAIKMVATLILFLISIAIAFILIVRKFNIALALGLALLIYSLPLLGSDTVKVFVETFTRTLLETIASLVLAMFLADLYRSTYIADSVVKSLEMLSPRVAAISIPAIIGLLPMPAGAYISATIINPLYTECRLTSQEKTFLNYWFRHIWVTIWPLYQSIILASAILNMSFDAIILHNWPIFIASIFSGIIVSRTIIYRINSNCIGCRDRDFKGLVHLWPFMAIVIMSMVLKLSLPLTLAIIIMMLIAVYRPSMDMIKSSFRYSLDPTIITLIIESMIFSRTIVETGLAHQLAVYLAPYADIAVFMIPFIMVTATGFEFTFVTIAFPAVLPLLTDYRITLAFLGGYMGAMLSPAHACFVLTAKFFRSDLGSVYRRYLILAAGLTIAIVIAIVAIINSTIFYLQKLEV